MGQRERDLMAYKFLSEEWAKAVSDGLAASEAFTSSAAMSLQFIVTDPPQGDGKFYMDATGAAPVQALGEMENPDVTITSSYETASQIFRGDLNTQMAFMTGKIKVAGNMAKLMTQQAALGHYATVVSGIDVEY
jgi:putative sterol carrier protein